MRKIGFALPFLLLSVLMPGGAGSDGALAATGDTLIVTGGLVNLRYGPSTDAKVRMHVRRNRLMTELERQGDWVRVEIAGGDGTSGWIHSSLLAAASADQMARARERASERPQVELPEVKPPVPPAAAGTSPAEQSPPVAPPAPAKPHAADTSRRQSVAVAPSGSAAESSPQAAVTPAAGPKDASDAAELARFRDSVDYLNSRSSTVAGANLFEGVEALGDGVVEVGATDAWSSIPPGGQQSYANTLVDRWAAARGYSGPATVRIVGPDGKVLLESKRP